MSAAAAQRHVGGQFEAIRDGRHRITEPPSDRGVDARWANIQRSRGSRQSQKLLAHG